MIARAAKHLDKAQRLQAEAEAVEREAQGFLVSGEPDDNTGMPPGDRAEAERLMRVHDGLMEKASRHAAKASRILDKLVTD